MASEPCLCGALDCRFCNPGGWREILNPPSGECYWCKDTVEATVEDDSICSGCLYPFTDDPDDIIEFSINQKDEDEKKIKELSEKIDEITIITRHLNQQNMRFREEREKESSMFLFDVTETDCPKVNSFCLTLASEGAVHRLYKETNRLSRGLKLIYDPADEQAHRNHRLAYILAVNTIGNKEGFQWNDCQSQVALENNARVLNARNKAMTFASRRWSSDEATEHPCCECGKESDCHASFDEEGSGGQVEWLCKICCEADSKPKPLNGEATL